MTQYSKSGKRSMCSTRWCGSAEGCKKQRRKGAEGRDVQRAQCGGYVQGADLRGALAIGRDLEAELVLIGSEVGLEEVSGSS